MIATVNTHHMFAFYSSSSGNFFESVVAIGHSVDFTVGEQTESVGGGNIFGLGSLFSFFSGEFGGLVSLGFGVEIRKLSGFDLSNFGIFSLFGQFLGVGGDFGNHDVEGGGILLSLGRNALLGFEERGGLGGKFSAHI